ncbi:MAG: hypothetical protein JST00_09820 [Deltaproteobacteria bacterium]|nr:hypothetical protein [Deltaproteobacteria bacterium]
MDFRKVTGALLLSLLAGTAACSADTEAGDVAVEGDEEDLTSITARSRTFEFVGTVYVEPNANDQAILQTVRSQSQTAFGPLRTAEAAVNSRELKEIDTTTFAKRPVKVVDTNVPNDPGRDMLEVKYTYKDNAVVALSYASRTSMPLAVMNPSYRSQTDRILRECTPNDEHSREFSSQIWYVFEPSLSQCQEAIRAEQTKVDADRNKLRDPRAQVAKSEVDRLYIPITAKLGADKTNRGTSYPEYHRLYKGGVKADKLVISLVYGLIDHENNGPEKDYNWGELMTTLSETMAAGGDWKIVPGPDQVDLASFTLASGKKVDNASIKDLVGLRSGGSSLALSYTEKQELMKLFAQRIDRKWIAIEKKIKVKVGAEAERDFGVQLLVYYGAQSSYAPHKYATKNSDVFLYNGHSSIGYGPLDPKNFTAADFPSTYQIMWVDGCVSYNYYEKDYIPLKDGGTKNLDLITNGVEAPSWRSGHAMGQFLITLLNGKNASYKDLLVAARDTEALRVVDGETDNQFRPSRYTVTIR